MRIGLLWMSACLSGATALGCASPPAAPPRAAEYFRAPRLDYVEPGRSASDGEVLGAHRRAPDDWIIAAPTNDHAAPGWGLREGRLRFSRERARGGHGVLVEHPSCTPRVPPRPLPLHELEARAAVYRAWLEARQAGNILASSEAVMLVAQTPPRVLDCQR